MAGIIRHQVSPVNQYPQTFIIYTWLTLEHSISIRSTPLGTKLDLSLDFSIFSYFTGGNTQWAFSL